MTRTPRWTPAELAILHATYWQGDQAIHAALTAAGYHRSQISVTRARQRANLHVPEATRPPRPVPNHQRILTTLDDYHPCPLTSQDLQDELNLTRAIVNAALTKYVNAGLLERRNDPNAENPACAPFLYFLVEAPSE